MEPITSGLPKVRINQRTNEDKSLHLWTLHSNGGKERLITI